MVETTTGSRVMGGAGVADVLSDGVGGGATLTMVGGGVGGVVATRVAVDVRAGSDPLVFEGKSDADLGCTTLAAATAAPSSTATSTAATRGPEPRRTRGCPTAALLWNVASRSDAGGSYTGMVAD